MTKSKVYNYSLQARGYELDSYNHVNNAVYLNYTEQARWDLFGQIGLLDNIRESGMKLVITEIKIKYIRQVVLFDEIVVETRMEPSLPFLIFHHHLINKKTKKTVAKVKVKSLFLDAKNKPCDFPHELMNIIKNNTGTDE